MPSLYIDPDDLAVSLKLTDVDGVEDDLERSCFAASGAIDEYCDRVFQMSDDTNDEARRFTALGPSLCVIDDLASFSQLRLDRAGNGTFGDALTEDVDFVLLTSMKPELDPPYERIRIRQRSMKFFPSYELAVEVTGRWGWLEVPSQIGEAAALLAAQLFRRKTSAVFGIIAVNQQTAMRVLRHDTHLCTLLEPFVRTNAEVG